jgi:hypothetical protein
MALTRRVIERQLDALTPHIARAWHQPWLMVAGGLAVGIALSRVPLLRLLGTSARVVQAGIAVAGTAAAVDQFLSSRRRRRRAA